jgi:hypothetical protein
MISVTETILNNLKTQITNNIATYVSTLTAAIGDSLVSESVQQVTIGARGLQNDLQYPAIIISAENAEIERMAFGRSQYKLSCVLSVICNNTGVQAKSITRLFRLVEALRSLIEQLNTLSSTVTDSKPTSLRYYNIQLDAVQLYCADLSIEVWVDYAD